MTHPAPLTACRTATPAEIPSTAARLARDAEAAGWRHRTTYAHGTTTDAQGHPSHLVESIVVRLRRDPLAAVAIWHDGKFRLGYVWSRYTSPRRIASRDLSRFIKDAA